MVSVAGISLMNGGYHHVHHLNRGRGVVRRVAGNIVGSAGHALLNRIAHIISGEGYRKRRVVHIRKPIYSGSYKLTGMGRKRRVGRPKVHHRKLMFVIGGRKRRVGKRNTTHKIFLI